MLGLRQNVCDITALAAVASAFPRGMVRPAFLDPRSSH
jgi:hypothetical protein